MDVPTLRLVSKTNTAFVIQGISFSCIKVPSIVPNRVKEENKVWIPDVLFFIFQPHLSYLFGRWLSFQQILIQFHLSKFSKNWERVLLYWKMRIYGVSYYYFFLRSSLIFIQTLHFHPLFDHNICYLSSHISYLHAWLPMSLKLGCPLIVSGKIATSVLKSSHFKCNRSLDVRPEFFLLLRS